MFTFAYCTDGDDALRLRATEFERHGRHIALVAERMRFGAPLAVRDTDTVAGDASIVASLLCYEADDPVEATAAVLDDPYVQSGAWSAVEFYTASALRLRPPAAALPNERWYLAALRRSDASAGFNVDDVELLLDQLGDRLLLGGLLACEGFVCSGPWRASALAAIVIFRAETLARAEADLDKALQRNDRPDHWSVLRIPRVAGSWAGISPNSVVGAHLAQLR